MERLRGQHRLRQRGGPRDAPRPGAAGRGLGAAARRALPPAWRLPRPVRRVRLGRVLRQRVHAEPRGQRRPRRVAPRRRALRADARQRRPAARDPVRRRADLRPQAERRRDRRARRGLGARRDRRRGGAGDGARQGEPRCARAAARGVDPPERDAGRRHAARAGVQRDLRRARLRQGRGAVARTTKAVTAPPPRSASATARTSALALDGGRARAAAAAGVRDRGLLPALARGGAQAPPAPAGRATARSTTAAGRTHGRTTGCSCRCTIVAAVASATSGSTTPSTGCGPTPTACRSCAPLRIRRRRHSSSPRSSRRSRTPTSTIER